jgi:hypothetical protein
MEGQGYMPQQHLVQQNETSASPISDQPFNIKNDDKNAQTPPTSADTHIAFNIKLYENGSSR